MMKVSRLVVAAGVTLFLAACGDAVTDTPLAPSGPLMDGGTYGVGGNKTPTDTTTTGSSGTAPQDSTVMGGGTYGVGGN